MVVHAVCEIGISFKVKEMKLYEDEIALYCDYLKCGKYGSHGCPCSDYTERPAKVIKLHN